MIRATSVRAERSRRLSVRRQNSRISRTSQCEACSRRTSSAASTAETSPFVSNTHVPISGSLKRRWRMASSSSRPRARGQNEAPASTIVSGVWARGPVGPDSVNQAVPSSRSRRTSRFG